MLFAAGPLALIDVDAGGTGSFANEPSPSAILFFLTVQAAVMTVHAGFDTGFSFFYTSLNAAGFVDVFDGLDGTGNNLGHILAVGLSYTRSHSAPRILASRAASPGVRASGYFPSFSGLACQPLDVAT